MNIKITPSSEFKKVLWKNGKGNTLELAKDDKDLANYSWRISIATVSENGVFSNFSGYRRNQVLLKGDGITLSIDGIDNESLNRNLTFLNYDGSCHTVGELKGSAVQLFNVMSLAERFVDSVETFESLSEISLKSARHCFIYGNKSQLKLMGSNGELLSLLNKGDLLHIEKLPKQRLLLQGEHMIVVYLNDK